MRSFGGALAPVIALLAALVLAPAASAGEREKLPVDYTVLGAMAAQGADAGGDPPGANVPGCEPSRRHPQPVVLVHGLLANQTVNWNAMAPMLANRGYCVYSFTYGEKQGVDFGFYEPGGLIRMQRSAAQLDRFVDRVRARTGSRKVDILGHSEGSLMPNWWIKYGGGAGEVDDYVGLTTLWDGTNAAGLNSLNDLAATFGLSGPIIDIVEQACESCPQFLASSKFIAKLNRGGIKAPGVSYTNIVTTYDELVLPYTSGLMREGPRAKNFVLQEECPQDAAEHLAVAFDPNAARLIRNALDPKRAVPLGPENCKAVTPLGAP
ncbi:lipase [Thermoleophilia bacterium SCSIO 60948]|nr:lipase [Thermoleophilia bacterium SCSIO 60948]